MSSDDIPSDFLATSPWGSGIRRAEGDLLGRRVGAYHITAMLGVGGMGEVYRARDTKLERDVAIKIVPPEFASDVDRRMRFEREARVLASLSHPHVAAIYGFEETEDIRALVLELVEGITLADRIAKGPLTPRETAGIAAQIADALQAAHERGIIHRDLKPSNIKVTANGQVKVLDFGLAKVLPPTDLGERDISGIALGSTCRGMILGTPAYMSPEQARGQAVDKRTDIWAFGCLLYELLTARHPFPGETVSDVIAAILERDPDWKALPVSTPQQIVHLLERCLEKDPKRRLRDIGDALIELQDIERPQALVTRRPRRPTSTIMRISAVMIVGAAVALYWVVSHAPQASSEPGPLKLVPLTTYPGLEYHPSLSPDGNQVAFTWNGERQDNWDIYVKMVGSSAAPLRITTHAADDAYPTWSPDGRHIAFARDDGIFVTTSLGGTERKVADSIDASGLSWSPDGKWIAVTDYGTRGEPGGIFFVPSEGGERLRVTSRMLPSNDRLARFSPDGKRLAFLRCSYIDVCDLHLADFDSEGIKNIRRLTHESSPGWGVAWTANAQAVVYSRRSGVSRVSVSGGSRASNPITLARQVSQVTVSGNRMVYVDAELDRDIWRFHQGRGSQKHIWSTRDDRSAMFSPDGSRIAFTSARSGNLEVWVANADGSHLLQLTSFGGPLAGTPRWSPDGRWIAFDVPTEGGARDIFVVDSAGGQPRAITTHAAQDRNASWSRDGRFIYFSSSRNGLTTNENDIFRVPVAGGDAIQITDQGGYVAVESVDSRTLYYTKNPLGVEAGPLFARPLTGGPERQVLDSVSARAFHVAAAGIYFIDASDEDGGYVLKFLEFSNRATSVLKRLEGTPDYYLSVSPDGQEFLYTLDGVDNADLTLVENFQ